MCKKIDTLLILVGAGDPFPDDPHPDRPLNMPVGTGRAINCCERLVLLVPGEEQGPRVTSIQAAVLADVPSMQVRIVSIPTGPVDTAGLVIRIAVALEDLLSEGVLVPERSGVSVTLGAPEAFDAWVLLSRGLLQGITLLNQDLEPYPLPAERKAGGRPSVLREPPVTYAAKTDERAGEPRALTRQLQAARRLGLRGNHPRLLEAVDTVAAVAGHSVPVLIEGETGTGKSLFARLAHELSDRDKGPFVAVNCAALPEKLVESTLFGHRKGAFTGATENQEGKFTLADGGTLFLDEIGELPLALQPKLLKVLDDAVVEPVGARSGHPVDTRVLTATNRDLRQDVAEGRFREDLYYRIAFGLVRLPPLRERAEDIPDIALHLLARLNAALQSPKQFSPAALQYLQEQPWRGNVRDLENVIGRSVLLCRGDTLQPQDLVLEPERPRRAHDLAAMPELHESFSLEDYLAATRRSLILRALELAHGNQSAAARKLGLSPQAVSKFVQREGL